MADETRPAADEGAPAPGAAPGPVPARPEPAASPAADGKASGRAAQLEAELARLRADAVAGAKVLLRVRPPHVLFSFAGHQVGPDPTPVPAHLASAITGAAADAGVTLQEG